MGELVRINGTPLRRLEYQDQPVVTLRQIGELHGSKLKAEANFQRNKRHFIKGTDYFHVTANEAGMNYRHFVGRKIPPQGVLLFTESGYLMIVKSFTDDLSWKVQRELVNCYFRMKEGASFAPPAIEDRMARLESMLGEVLALMPKKPAKAILGPGEPNFLRDRFMEMYGQRMNVTQWLRLKGVPLSKETATAVLYRNMRPGPVVLVTMMLALDYTKAEIRGKLSQRGKAPAAVMALLK